MDNDIKEYVAFILREAFRDSRVKIDMLDQEKWVLIFGRFQFDFIADSYSGIPTMLIESQNKSTFQIAIPCDHYDDKKIRKFLKSVYDLQQIFLIDQKPWENLK